MAIHRFLAVLATLALLGLSQPARAQSNPINTLSVADAERTMQALNITFEERGNNTYLFTVDGARALFFNKGKNVQFYAGFKMNRPLTLSRINEWNRSKRFSRAYIDDKGDPVVEMDIDLEGGATLGTVQEGFRTWLTVMRAFMKHIDFKV